MLLLGLGAMAKVLIMSSAGVMLRRRGLLPPEATKAFSKCFVHAFLPCLLATRVAATMDSTGKLGIAVYLWAAAVAIVAAGWAVGSLLRALARPPPHFSDPFVVAVWNSNSNSLPIALATSLCYAAFPDDPGAEHEAVSLLALYAVAYQPVVWFFAPRAFARASAAAAASSEKPSRALALVANASHTAAAAAADDSGGDVTNARVSRARGLYAFACRRLLTPPVVGVLLGLICGLVPALRSVLIDQDGALHFVWRGLSSLGSAAVPVSMVVLGANLASGRAAAAALGNRSIAAICVGKLVIMPALMFTFLVFATPHIDALRSRPVLLLVFLLETVTPSANNNVVICTLYGEGAAEMSALLFYEYVVAIVSITLWVSAFTARFAPVS